MQRVGPILQFLGCQDNVWGISILVVTDAGDAQPDLGFARAALATTCSSAPVPGLPCIAWRFDTGIPLTDAPQTVDYFLAGQAYRFELPAAGAMPTLGYVSCNGYSDARARRLQRAPNALWEHMAQLHGTRAAPGGAPAGPLHLLLHGGDQVYSDDMWAALPELRAWSERDWYQRCTVPLTDSLRSDLQTHFAQLYLTRWSEPVIAHLLARVPSVMMWDDHDIMDGWGSRLAQLHDSPVCQGLFAIAKAAFELFQRQMFGAPPPATLPGQPVHHSAYRVGPAGLLVLDMRSERRPLPDPGSAAEQAGAIEQVVSAQGWQAVYAWLDAQAGPALKHLFVMSSIPVLHPSFATLESLLGGMLGQQELEDDLRDHWTSRPNLAERLRLIHRLLDASARGTRITVLSGDVHVAALGVIESDRRDVPANANVINQLTSSGIEHPAPAGVALSFVEQACQLPETIDRGITGTMMAFPTSTQHMIGRRNYLTLHPDAPGGDNRYWANWWAEDVAYPYTKVIHPVG